jgi:putative endonuclease
MRIWEFYVYIVTNLERTVLYVGVTNCLEQRLIEHYLNRGKEKTFGGRYFCHHLLYYEVYKYVNVALAREREIKGWRRSKKEALINSVNPGWRFLNEEIMRWPPPATAVSRQQRR